MQVIGRIETIYVRPHNVHVCASINVIYRTCAGCNETMHVASALPIEREAIRKLNLNLP